MLHQLRLTGTGFTSDSHRCGVLIAGGGKQAFCYSNHAVARGSLGMYFAYSSSRHNFPLVVEIPTWRLEVVLLSFMLLHLDYLVNLQNSTPLPVKVPPR